MFAQNVVVNTAIRTIGMMTMMGTTRLEEENERLKEVNRQLTADYTRSLERLKSDCIQIDELKAEVKELEAERNRYAATLAKYQMASDKEIAAHVKDTLNRLKQCSRCDNFFTDGKWHRYVFIEDIDKLLEELNK